MTPPKIILPDDDDALIAACDIETFRSSGPGGQHVNTTDSAVRLRHRPTGLVVVSRMHRSQLRNRYECARMLRERVRRLNYRKPPRVDTKVPRAAKRRRLDQKRQTSGKKQMRRRPGTDE